MVTIKVKRLKTLKERAVGLIGKKEITPVMFETRFGIHTFGLKFPIDVLILDNQKRVVAFRELLTPNRIFLWNPRYKTVIEAPIGTIKKLQIKKGDLVQF